MVQIERSSSPIKLDFPYGTILAGGTNVEFRLTTAIRQGGNGVVFRAERVNEDGQSAGPCAVKLLKQLDEVRQDRFDNEVRIIQALNHPNIAKCYGHGRTRLGHQNIEIPWVAMDLGGPNLGDYQDEFGFHLDTPTALNIGIQIGHALQHLHDMGIIHRDLKPGNFVWSDEDDREEVLMIDFGIAKYIGEDVSGRKMDTFTQANEFVGPANFSSPELIAYGRNKKHPVDYQSDLFQLGLVLWFFATNQIIAGIPSKTKDPTGGALWELVTSLLAMEPADRPNSAGDIVNRLEQIRSKVVASGS
ncbi:MAG: serine/threonine protein kinase [Planctomycetes bacterium]|nr:serine/threonine protein kinase [Planctomycetota bacterium]